MGVVLDVSRNINNHSALLPNLNKSSLGSQAGSTKNVKPVSRDGTKHAATFSEASKETLTKTDPAETAPKSIKSLFQ